ncbi:class I SAM-dependent methyltransferase [Pseudonocardia acidicola]|uniref:Methyltransferase domain-containing protein n=1 Tax=Pseudonocardia acidicola TaxID=2724939 RepID=A0ABX1S9B3_9PSEU|nr:class I SAM-dependent methyltransferase [Pseudonocardia acidicola]NMH98153.1 methyltransferase domain-containing protein [Pseudonocardia acidicola]
MAEPGGAPEAAAVGPAITADGQVGRIFEWRRGFDVTWLLAVGLRSGIVHALAAHPGATATELAERLELHGPYTAAWLRTAQGFEIVDVDRPGYRLAPHLDTILTDASDPRYLAGYILLGAEVATRDFEATAEAMRTGAVVPFQGRGDLFTRLVAEATRGLQTMTARGILPKLPGVAEALRHGGTVLEIGCGTGNLLLALAAQFPTARCIGVDIDADSLAAAGEKITTAGLDRRVTLHHGAVAEAVAQARPGGVDVVVLVEVLHEIAPALRPGVIGDAAAALRPGGWLVIVDETYPSTAEQAREPEYRFPLMTGFEELLWGNVLPTREEQEQLLAGAGLTGPVDRRLVGEGFTVLTTAKPH